MKKIILYDEFMGATYIIISVTHSETETVANWVQEVLGHSIKLHIAAKIIGDECFPLNWVLAAGLNDPDVEKQIKTMIAVGIFNSIINLNSKVKPDEINIHKVS